MNDILFHNATVVNGGRSFHGFVAIKGELISAVGEGEPSPEMIEDSRETVDLKNKMIMPGVIDDQVHFREPGLTHKADMGSESRAALAGGVTSFMDMPNCKPPTVTVEAWRDKMERAEKSSAVNYAFWMGATNDNTEVLSGADYSKIPGVKVFLGASTGNMLVDDEEALNAIFSLGKIVAIHSEDEGIIRANISEARKKYGDQVPVSEHPKIRSTEACVASTVKAISRAKRFGTRLHILHLSTADEARMLYAGEPSDKLITSEVCVHHLWFTDKDYARLGSRIKWNPAVKTEADRDELRRAVADGRIDIVATDHAPHLLSEKEGDATHAASGGPLIQHSLLMMLELARLGLWGVEKVVEMMSHRPADLFGINRRGYIREGHYADLVVVNPGADTVITRESLLTKCGWSPLEGERFSCRIEAVYVNGSKAYEYDCGHKFLPHVSKPLNFNHRND